MLILDENNDCIILDNVHSPLVSEFFWVLDLEMMDYTLTPLQVLEETICPVLTVNIQGFQFQLPTTWNILILSTETYQVDVVEISRLPGREFTAFQYGPNSHSAESSVVRVVDYSSEGVNVSPSLSKNQMLCHPVSPKYWINIAPSDGYNKYLKGISSGDITG